MSKIGIGQVFVDGDAKSYMLVQTSQNTVCLIYLKNGNRWRDPITVADVHDISKNEWTDLTLRVPLPMQCISEPLPSDSAPSSYMSTQGVSSGTVPYVGGSYVWVGKADWPDDTYVIDVVVVSEQFVDYTTTLGGEGTMTCKHFSKNYVPVTKRSMSAPITPITEYAVVKGDCGTVQIKVNKLLEAGWVLNGGVSGICTPLGNLYMQSLTLTQEQK